MLAGKLLHACGIVRSDAQDDPRGRLREQLDVRPEVAKAVIEAGYDLLELRPVGMSLEEIFLELTREDVRPVRKER